MRDRRTLMILLFIPVFFLLLFGYALTFDIKHVALAVQDRDDSVESRASVSAFLTSGYFDYAGAMHAPADLERMMDTNRARAALVIPERTGSALRRSNGAGADHHQRREHEHRGHGARLLEHHRAQRVRPTSWSRPADAPSCRR